MDSSRALNDLMSPKVKDEWADRFVQKTGKEWHFLAVAAPVFIGI
jgi:hypothetical protein